MSTPAPVITTPTVQFKNILYATDFSEYSREALPYAEALAKKFGSHLHLCHVVIPSALAASAPEAAPYLYEAERKTSQVELEKMATTETKKGLETELLVRSGLLEDALAEVVESNSIDLVVAGTHGRTGVRRLLLGSAVETICRVATCPVLTVGPLLAERHVIKFKHILFPTDFSEESRRVLPCIVAIAEEYGSTVTVLNVVHLDKPHADTKKLVTVRLSDLQSVFGPELSRVEHNFIVDFGDTAETILRVSREKKAELIGIGLRNFGGIHLRSSIGYKVMAGAHCPVLTTR
jgi:nucleotide-binding universal stress UspA family protein